MTTTWVALGLGFAIASAAGAQTPLATGAAAGADGWNAPQAEQTLVLRLQGDAVRGEAAFTICQGCHRPGALGRVDGSYPRLAGQHATVLIKQMTDIRSGLRSNPKMQPFADEHALSPQDIADIASWLQGLRAQADHGIGPGADLDRAAAHYQRDCALCHGAAGQGDAARFYPRIAGQHYRYLLRTSLMIRDGQRRNGHPLMVDAVRGYTPDDLSALADLVSRMPSQAGKLPMDSRPAQ